MWNPVSNSWELSPLTFPGCKQRPSVEPTVSMVTSAGSWKCAPFSLPLSLSWIRSRSPQSSAGSPLPVCVHACVCARLCVRTLVCVDPGVCSSRVTTGAMTRTWWPSLVLQTTAIAVETRQPSWNWTTLWNTLCKLAPVFRADVSPGAAGCRSECFPS